MWGLFHAPLWRLRCRSVWRAGCAQATWQVGDARLGAFPLFARPPAARRLAVDAQTNWDQITENIARSALLNTAPGLTTSATCRRSFSSSTTPARGAQSDANDAANPYRGAFAQISLWRREQGGESIGRAQRCPCSARRCRWRAARNSRRHASGTIDSLQQTVNGTLVPLYRYPDPHWSIVVECCEQLERPTLRIADAVFATTRGVGRAHRVGSQKQIDSAVGTRNGLALADDYDYVTKLDCTQAENICEAGELRVRFAAERRAVHAGRAAMRHRRELRAR